MEEIFLRIEDYDDYYVSNLGNVLSLKGKKERFLKLRITNFGYFIVNLHKEGKIKTFYVHRLVAQAFIPNPYNLLEVNHKNEIKTDNRVENLEWCTSKYNTRYSKAKRVGCYDKDWNLIKIYDSILDCELDGHYHGHVSKCCQNKPGYHTHHGYRWKFIFQ